MYFYLLLVPLFLWANEKPVVVPVMFMKTPMPPPYRAYLNNLEEGEYLTVFRDTGLDWKSCEDREIDARTGRPFCKQAAGWVDRESKIQVIGDIVEKEVTNLYTGEREVQKYVKVRFFYARMGDKRFADTKNELVIKDDEGYIEYHQIYAEPMKTFFGKDSLDAGTTASPTNKPACPLNNCTPTVASPDLKNQQQQTKPFADLIANLGVDATAKELNKVVGFCAINGTPSKYPKKIPKGNTYDTYIYNRIMSGPRPSLQKENGSNVTHEDLVNVDAMARTLYGEMASCYKYGLHYPLSVARVILNRSEDKDALRLFAREKHAKGKPTMAQIATTTNQFTMWQPSKLGKKDPKGKRKRLPNGPLHQGLCPPREIGKPFYRNQKAPKAENDIWINSMRIATEAVLFPEKFKRRSPALTQKHYTSNLVSKVGTPEFPQGGDFIKRMTQVFPLVDGRRVQVNECLEVWAEKK